ncbi:MAG: hypothetical protein P4L50_30430, partial [Anaerolineaceae bacterium]|nr:hypothetical protein [Anaerolineaceae bacterium]
GFWDRLELPQGRGVLGTCTRIGAGHDRILRSTPVKWRAQRILIENAQIADRRGWRRLINRNSMEGHGVGHSALPPPKVASADFIEGSFAKKAEPGLMANLKLWLKLQFLF